MDDACFRGGAAHVERDRVLEPDAVAQRLGADDAGRRSGLQHADARALRFLDAEKAAGRLHDEKVTSETGGLKVLAHLAEIAAHARSDIGVRRCRRGALELAIFLGKLVRGGDEEMRMSFLDDLLHPLLMRGIVVGV